MRIYFMKQPAVDFFKENMERLYINYFQKEDNSWMEEEYGEDPFVLLDDIPSFDLAPLTSESAAGEIDFDNCKRVYGALSNLSDSQASDERLWAGLCNGTFYKYLRQRYGYDCAELKDKEKDASGIISRFFFAGGRRSGLYRNTLSKCWWTGRVTYDKNNHVNHYEMLDAIGSNDISTKISDILFSYLFTANPTILKGICDALKHYSDNGVKLLVRDHIRPAMQYLNVVGGVVLLDVLSADEIKELLITKIDELLGKDTRDGEVAPDEKMDTTNLLDQSEVDSLEKSNHITEEEESVSTYNEETGESKPEHVNDISKPETVSYGCTIKVKNTKDNTVATYVLPAEENKDAKLDLVEKKMLNKTIGYRIYMRGAWLELIDIEE